MMILHELENYQPLRRLQSRILGYLISAQLNSIDLRWSLLALALKLLAIVWTTGRRRLVSPRASRTSHPRNPADTMVATAFR